MASRRHTSELFQSLEQRVYLSGAVSPLPPSSGSTVQQLYRIPELIQTLGLPSDLLASPLPPAQLYFNILHQMGSDPVPQITAPASAVFVSPLHNSAALGVSASYIPGESQLTYGWSEISGPSGAGNPVFSINGTNAAKNTTVTFNQAGDYSFQVLVTGGAQSVSQTVVLHVDQVAANLVVTRAGNPSSSLTLNSTAQFVATVTDQFGAAMTTAPTWTLDSGSGGTLSATGFYQAPGQSGTATIRASAAGVTGSAVVTVTSAAPTVATNASAGASTVSTNSTTLSVLGADDGGESNLTYLWSMLSAPSGGTATFSLNGSNSAKNTVVTFSKAGSYSFLVTISDGSNTVTSNVTLNVAQTLTSITVTPGSPALNLNQNQSLSATGYDQFGAALAVQPTFTWSKFSGVGSVNGSGLYNSGSAGTAGIRATSGGVSGSASITVTNASPTVATPASSGASTVTTTSTTLSVSGADDGGETNLTYTWSAVTVPSGGTATFSLNGSNSAKNTVVTFNKAGSYSFLVTISDGAHSVTSSVTLSVTPSLAAIAVTPGSVGLNLNQNQSFSAIAYDQFGAALTVQPAFTWSKVSGAGSIDGSGNYNAGGSAGSATIKATSGAVSGSSIITITSAAPTIATPAAVFSQTLTTATLTALGADDGGEGNLTYSWSAITVPTGATPTFSINSTNGAKSTVVTFNRAGSYTFRVTISDGASTVTSNITLTVNQALSMIVVTPGTPSVNTSATQQFSATGYDQFAQAMTAQPSFTWSVDIGGAGTVDGTGNFTAASSAGAATVRATSGGSSGTGSATITAPASSTVTITTRNMTSFTELVITGTSSNHSIFVTQSGNTLTIISDGVTQTITGNFGDMKIYAGSAGSTITVGASVTLNNMIYGGAGSDTIADAAIGSYNAVITIGGGTDTVTGNGLNTNYWADTGDTLHAAALETNNGYVHQIAAFYQPWTTTTTDPNYISTQLLGQNLADPTDIGGVSRFTQNSLWGTAPVMADVRQGGVNDCYLMADLAGLASAVPGKLETVAVDLGDGTYAVQFVRNGVVSVVRVDGDLSGSYATVGSTGNLWAPIIEKAYAFFRQGTNAYASLNFGSPNVPLNDIGFANTYFFPRNYSEASLATAVNLAASENEAIMLPTNGSITDAPLIAAHCYTILSATLGSDGHYLFTVRNPWGVDGAGSDSNPNDGLVQITYTQLISNMAYGAITQ